MTKWWLLPLAGRYLVLLMSLIPCTGRNVNSKKEFYEITVPKKLELRDGSEIKDHMSYTIMIEGKNYVVHLTPNRDSLSPNFTVFTYTDEETLLVEQPYLREHLN
ncbi:disintegrin and metalloproteinase domain-containing protein 9-like [Rhinatrema bivittatum]|uniref:disintegrin and metalloproteinase domain-containing protein 9-like n=1 Tax=Rhinatrema bivittatum TaxID=194408 RepID=UPI00112B85C7|nr:disintegrin and metalloproteinase domain-containing protein 9-like [Rhinatrema bivittatum]